MTQQRDYLMSLATKTIEPYTRLDSCRAAMVTGSTAKGVCDNYSDLDLTIYYDGVLPDEDQLTAIRQRFGALERKWTMGDRTTNSFAEAYEVNGIEVQIGHTTIAVWEESIAKVREGLDCDSPLQKAMEGTLACKALFGDDHIRRWQELIADYPPDLGKAMVRKHLSFFPLWGLQSYLQDRDATIWYYESLVEATQNIIAVLAGLNQLYFTSFQFKRMARFIDQMELAPSNLAVRLEALFQVDNQNLEDLEALVAETIALVETAMPSIDTSRAKRRLGWRHEPWKPTGTHPEIRL